MAISIIGRKVELINGEIVTVVSVKDCVYTGVFEDGDSIRFDSSVIYRFL